MMVSLEFLGKNKILLAQNFFEMLRYLPLLAWIGPMKCSILHKNPLGALFLVHFGTHFGDTYLLFTYWVKATDSQGSDLKAVELQCFTRVLFHKIITYSGILQLQNLSIFVQSCQYWEEIFDPWFCKRTNDLPNFLPFLGFSYKIWVKYKKITNIFFKTHL